MLGMRPVSGLVGVHRCIIVRELPGGRLTCGDRQGGLSSWGVRLPRLSLADRALLVVCGPGAGQHPGAFAGEQDQSRLDTIAGGALVGDAASR